MVKFKVGDKVRITDVSKIAGGHNHWRNGDVTTVEDKRRSDGAIELARTLHGKYDSYGPWLSVSEMVGIEHVENEQYQRITTLEKANADMLNEIKTLSSRITALEEAKPQKVVIESHTFTAKSVTDVKKIAESLAKLMTRKQTPNQRRKAVIERAKAFVEDVEYLAEDSQGNAERWDRKCATLTKFSTYASKPEYHVNKEKRVVTVLVKGSSNRIVLGKAIAKCSPDDVFNVHIGKAIALAKAYGLEVPREFTHAPQPEPAIGQVVAGTKETTTAYYRKDRKFTLLTPKLGGFTYVESREYGGTDTDWIMPNDIGRILDDSEAQYDE